MSETCNLIVYKASAGSGKTFTLVKEYLTLALSKSTSYRNILAVTFTNKATIEMKERILSVLYGLAYDLKDSRSTSYRSVLCESLHIKPSELQQRCHDLLSALLHDYNRFYIETIDTFFQRILHNMTRELGVGSKYNIEIQTQDILKKSIDKTIESASEDPELFSWLASYVNDRIADGKPWNFSKDILDFGDNLFKEKFKMLEDQIHEKINRKSLADYRSFLQKTRNQIQDQLLQFQNEFFQIQKEHGFSEEDFAYKKKGAIGLFYKLSDFKKLFEDALTSKRHLQAYESTEEWFTKAKLDNNPLEPLVVSTLHPLFKKTFDFLKEHSALWHTTDMIMKTFNNLGLVYDFSCSLEQEKKKENKFLLSDTANLLDKMVGENDISFIFEKIGAIFKHIMIDEFQDTSQLSWKNFQKLLQENLDYNRRNIIVGDVKQSIYRWTNGDWSILNNLDQGLFPNTPHPRIPQIETLNTNFRSTKHIVIFNNSVFSEGIPLLSQALPTSCEDEYISRIQKIYADAMQHHKKDGGYVHVSFLEEKTSASWKQEVISKMILQVESLQEQGVSPNQIAILTRTNKDINVIAQALSDYQHTCSIEKQKQFCYDIVSNEAFRYDNSTALQIIIAALSLLNEEQDVLNKALLSIRYQEHNFADFSYEEFFRNYLQKGANALLPKAFLEKGKELKTMPLMSTIEEIIRIFELEKMSDQEGYLFAFLDQALDFTSKSTATISSFLSYWEDTLASSKTPINDNIQGFRAFTIHKSKGMEFEHVFIPFCNWPLTKSKSEILWVETQGAFSSIPILPVSFVSQLQQSLFRQEYNEEVFQQIVDNINVLYVALTRPKQSLFIWGSSPSNTSGSSLKTVSDWLFQILSTANHSTPSSSDFEHINLNEYWDNDTQHFEFGVLSEAISTPKEASATEENIFELQYPEILLPFTLGEGKIIYAQTSEGEEFLASFEETNDQPPPLKNQPERHKGIIFHDLLSRIKTEPDIDRAIDECIFSGLITHEDKNYCMQILSQMIGHPTALPWFTLNNQEIICEMRLVAKENDKIKEKRPDRVIISPKETLIIDYKFGKQSAELHSRNQQQIANYKSIFEQMGYQNITTVLWYVDTLSSDIRQDFIIC